MQVSDLFHGLSSLLYFCAVLLIQTVHTSMALFRAWITDGNSKPPTLSLDMLLSQVLIFVS